ncbi:glycerate kinase [Rhizobium sp. CNPSo 3968]|uniref:glycerate kinase type-2 family protein n=1 Tax=Rhizobium sp. CNPSo 3968 TaxID=3021408 RepID=UPI00254E10CD|nr:glycerate kinase [Rhizobium sp. CNPSo 3968]MDK4717881.1 glycerate kinase [Rhizobium sp. CNPSo 3968]
MTWDTINARGFLTNLFTEAIASANPRNLIRKHLPVPPHGRCIVVGAGKASAAMAAALDTAWPDVDLSGVVVTRYGHAVPAGRIEVLEASHPVPDDRSVEAACRMLSAVRNLKPDDLVVSLVSGGGSSLLVAPAGQMSIEDKKAVNRALLLSGATISEMNRIRTKLSLVKGGGLAAAAFPAKVVTLLISDVPGDQPAEIASGPTVKPIEYVESAYSIARRYNLDIPEAAWDVLRSKEPAHETRFPEMVTEIIASPRMALEACAASAKASGVTPIILGDALEGESKELGRLMAGIATSVKRNGHPVQGPAVLLSGGETTVTIGGGSRGKGGRNTEFLLSLAVELRGTQGVWAIAGDTDGIDGSEDAAGAFITPTTISRMQERGIDPRLCLEKHDSYTAFRAVDDLIVTGPTLTNVNDVRAILID